MDIDFTYTKQEINDVSGYIFKGKSYRCSYTRFPTLYKNPAKGTETVELYNFTPKSEVRASTLVVHGLGSRNVKYLLWLGPHLASVGVNTTVLVLPGNHTRVENNSVSGKSFFWPDVKVMYQFWEHSVVDVLSTIDFLEQKGLWKENNCLVGYCLGGMISSIVASLDKRVSQTIFMTTGGHIPKIMHESSTTAFLRRMFAKGVKPKYDLDNKDKLYDIYNEQLPRIKNMSFEELATDDTIHPLLKIDPLSYAHLLDKSKISFIDALFDQTLPIESRRSLYKAMNGGRRHVLPITHTGWLPFQYFLGKYILHKVNLYTKKTAKQLLKKQQFDDILTEFFDK